MVDVRLLRLKKLLSQKELAEKSGVSQQLISMIENGSRNATIKTAKALAPHLGVKWTKFFDEKGA